MILSVSTDLEVALTLRSTSQLPFNALTLTLLKVSILKQILGTFTFPPQKERLHPVLRPAFLSIKYFLPIFGRVIEITELTAATAIFQSIFAIL